MHLVYLPHPPHPPQIRITIVFDFSWDDCNTQEKLETMVMQDFGGKQDALWSMWKMMNYVYHRVKAELKSQTWLFAK